MEAVLLAGGLGTRLRSIVSDRPKPMALIEGRPFMEYVIHQLSLQGVETAVVLGFRFPMLMRRLFWGQRGPLKTQAGL